MSEPEVVLKRMNTYIEDGLQIAVHMKGQALMQNNTPAFISAQGAIDVLLDLQSIMGGKEITTLEEIREDMKKAEEEQEDKGTPYMQ